MTITIETARRIVDLHNWVANLRKDIAEIDSGTVKGVTVSAYYTDENERDRWGGPKFKREAKFDGDEARWIANMIRKRKQNKLDAYLRELRQLNASIPE